MSKIKKAQDITYLALEGGGGKGIAYIGAIKALEKLRVLTIDRGQIKGISGASAGAITALLLALRLNAQEMLRLFLREDLNRFFGKPRNGLYRTVDKFFSPGGATDQPQGAYFDQFVKDRMSQIELAKLAQFPLLHLIENSHLPAPIRERFVNGYMEYAYNLLYDRGIFAGFEVREFFDRLITTCMKEKYKRTVNGGELSFQEFYKITGIDLIITGTNVTRRKSLFFSQRLTPQFPVAEAVGISMNLPLLFKPVRVDAVMKGLPDPNAYKGFWVDGGLMNNLPIHAFDHYQKPTTHDPELLPLHPSVLGLRLMEGYKDKSKNKSRPGQPTDTTLLPYIGELWATIASPAEEGQLRTASEKAQTIDIYTDELSTTEFRPPLKKAQGPMQQAEQAIYDYFNSPYY